MRVAIKQSLEADLAINGGTPVRGKDRPLPGVFPRAIPVASKQAVSRVLESGFTADTIGEFERAFAAACGVKHAVGLANCTSAIHAVVAALRLGPGDDVVVSSITDFGSVGGVIAQGANPVFPDVDIRNGNVTADHIARVITPRTKAVIAVHFYGLLCDMDPIVELAKSRDLTLIEDVCQAPLARYKGRIAGTIGDVGCFSFDAEKHLSTDHGGMAITDDGKLADAIRLVAHNRGATPAPGFGRAHDVLGFNFRYGRLEAAVGLGQLDELPRRNQRRRELADRLSAKLAAVNGIIPPYIPPGCDHVYWLYHFRIDPAKFRADAAVMAGAMSAEGLECGTAPYYLIPEGLRFLPDRAERVARLPNAVEHLRTTIRWPWTDKYSDEDVDDVAGIIAKVAEAYRA